LNGFSYAIETILAMVLSFLAPARTAAPLRQIAGVRGGTIKSSTVVINVYATVEERHGQVVRNLNKDDFELSEDGIPQKIEYFSPDTDVALSLGIALDTSNSQSALLGTEKKAAKEFLNSVLQRGDQAFAMSFDTDVRLLEDFTNARGKLEQAIDSAEINETGKSILEVNGAGPPGGTHLYDAVYLASSELMKARHGREVLVLVTDGEDQGSKTDLQKSIEAAEKANVIVYSIIVSDPEFYTLMDAKYHGDARVRKLANATGGCIIRAKSSAQIGQAFEQIAGELRSQYRLGYSPSNLRHDGSFRRIHVTVRGHNYNILARNGYYDGSDEKTKPRGSSQ
jgi:VWFA-related protein